MHFVKKNTRSSVNTKMRSVYSVFLLTLSLLIINGQPTKRSDITSVSSGTSFGFCRGYCRQSINVTPNPSQVTVSREPNFDQGSYPPVHVNFPVDTNEWTELVDLVDLETIEAMDERIGCPDCADGGAEWIQIDWSNGSKRVTFENGQTVERIEKLVRKLRDLRQTYLSKV